MAEYFQKNLFKGISMEEYKHLLICLDGRSRQFRAGKTTCDYDQGLNDIGTTGKGTASIVCCEFSEVRVTLKRLSPQDIFGYLLSYKDSESTDISVVSDSTRDTLFIHYAIISSPCTKTCTYHHQLIQNPPGMISKRALSLSREVEASSQHITREEPMCYSFQLAAQMKSPSFCLSFIMMDLANYLSTGRSAMIRELKHMKEERIIEMDKRSIHLYV